MMLDRYIIMPRHVATWPGRLDTVVRFLIPRRIVLQTRWWSIQRLGARYTSVSNAPEKRRSTNDDHHDQVVDEKMSGPNDQGDDTFRVLQISTYVGVHFKAVHMYSECVEILELAIANHREFLSVLWHRIWQT